MKKLFVSIFLCFVLIGCSTKNAVISEPSNLFILMDKNGFYVYAGNRLGINTFKKTIDNLSPSIQSIKMEFSGELNMGNILKMCNAFKELRIKKDVYYMDGEKRKSLFCV